jgi:tetratricopeptide (TPR) repeat protein
VKRDPDLGSTQSCPACRADAPDIENSAIERALLFATRAANDKDLDEEKREEYQQKALAELERLRSSDTPSTRFQVMITRGEVLRALGHHAEAIEAFEKILELQEEGLEGKAGAETLLQQFDEAVAAGREDDARVITEQLREALSKEGEFGIMFDHDILDTHLMIAESKEVLEDWEGAFDVYKWKLIAVFKFDSNDLPLNHTAVHQRRLYMGMSRCLYQKGDYEASIEFGEGAIGMNRHFPQVHKYVALSQKAKGDQEAAFRTMARAVHYETPWDGANKKKVLEMYENMKNNVEC